MPFQVLIFFILQIVNLCLANHYKGGTISWIPVNPYSLVSPVDIYITERHSWTLTRYECNQTTITTFGVFNDSQSTEPATLNCTSSQATCTASLYQSINSPLVCTDFSLVLQYSSGIYTSRQSLAINSSFDIAWRGAAWAVETLTNQFSLLSYINLTPVSGNKINTSPVTASVPVIRLLVNSASSIQILAADWDSDQVIRCRWSYQLPTDECGNICFDLPNGMMQPELCTITWTAVLRPADIASGLNESTYVVAITAEDFSDESSTTALSSTPHQMLVQVYTPPTGACATIPNLVQYPFNNQGCFGVAIGSLYSFTISARVYCVGDSIVEFTTLSPLYMQETNLTQTAINTWSMTFKWTPRSNQTGVQPFCVAAIDNNGLSTTQYCISMAVSGTSTVFITPAFVQGSASPVGTVMSTLSRFSIQANVPIKRPMRSGSQIRIYQNNILVTWYDCLTSPDVFYFNNTLVFFIRNYAWIPGVSYYVVLLEGVATADQYCGMESPAYGSSLFWPFTIWDPLKSSTNTPSTTTSPAATTHTVTTRAMGTTTYNPLFTTTGIPAYTTSTIMLTTPTTFTSVTTVTTTSETTTTTTTAITTQYVPDADVIYPKDFEQQCLQPVTLITVIVTLAFIPVHLFGMISLFSKMNSNLEKQALKNRYTRRNRFKTRSFRNEENQAFV